MPGNPLVTTAHTQHNPLSRIEAQLDTIQKSLDRLIFVLETQAHSSTTNAGNGPDVEPIELHLDALCNTQAGPGGQVVPGSMLIKGPEAKDFLQALGQATIIPLTNMPPWTHMALADKAWWLLQMH